MPQITIQVGGRERLEPAITKATPLGALGTEAWSGSAPPASAAAPPRSGPWLTPWSRPRTWPTTTTPTPTPSTSASRPSVTPTVDRPAAAGQDQPEPLPCQSGPSAAATASTRPAHISRARP
jgi:hypothetical protein